MKSVYSAVRTGALKTAVCAQVVAVGASVVKATAASASTIQHKLIGFYNRDEKCLQRGTDWVFKLCSLRFVFKGSISLGSLDNSVEFRPNH